MKPFIRLTDDLDKPVCVNVHQIVKITPYPDDRSKSVVYLNGHRAVTVKMELNNLCNLINGE